MPFCPKCKSEYRQGFTVCSDCQIPLVDNLPEYAQVPTEVDSAALKYVTIFVSDEPEEADRVRSILDENKIPYITRGEEETEFKYVDFLVREDKLKEAKDLLKEIIEQESRGINTEYPISQKDIPEEIYSKKETNNFYFFILTVVIIGLIFIS